MLHTAAHEIQHIEQRHSVQTIVKDLRLRCPWLVAPGEVSGGLISG